MPFYPARHAHNKLVMEISLENVANEHFAKQDYTAALEAYLRCLELLPPVDHVEDRVRLLLSKSACLLRMKQYDKVIGDCKQSLTTESAGNDVEPQPSSSSVNISELEATIHNENQLSDTSISQRSLIHLYGGSHARAQSRMISALCRLGRFSDAEELTKQWMATQPQSAEAKKMFEKLNTMLTALEDESLEDDDLLLLGEDSNMAERVPPEGMEEETGMSSPNSLTITTNPILDDNITTPGITDEKNGEFFCSYCEIQFANKVALQVHCRGESHQSIIMSDEGHSWKYRPPPRGLGAEQYTLCERYMSGETCRLGERCCEAHSTEELTEWKERFTYRQVKIQRAREKQLHGNSYTEQLLERWMQAANPDKIMRDSLDNVHLQLSSEMNVTMSSKRSVKDWTFIITSQECLHRAALLNDAHRTHFYIATVSTFNSTKKLQKSFDLEHNCQEWLSPDISEVKDGSEMEFRIKVVFRSDIYGTFRQSIVFDFGSEPVLLQRLCVDVIPVSEIDKLQKARETILCTSERWDPSNATIVSFIQRYSEEDRGILTFYPAPQATKLMVTQSLMEKNLTKENYITRMHELIYIEELAQYENIARFNVTTVLQLTNRYLLMPSTVSTAKYAQCGELFAKMKLNADISEDTAPGRLILTNVYSVLFALSDSSSGHNGKKRVYEAVIEDKGKSVIYLKISAVAVNELNLKTDQEIKAEIQFQLNRLPLCEMHHAVDKLPILDLVFPDLKTIPPIPWTPHNSFNDTFRQWSELLDSRLNPKQREAILAITTPTNIILPPILLIGPFGTGKTYTLAQAVKQILLQPDSRVLICTHSNSAADLYIKDYLHPYVQQGHVEARPLRVYYKNRWVQTVHPIVLQYCLINGEDCGSAFSMPNKDDVLKHRVVVATLTTSRYLTHIRLEKGFFSHILVDEAAQAMECESIMPLALANESTRIVLAGDHMQLSPEVYSLFAQDRRLHISLLERLYDMYPSENPCKILLCENYRSHDAIIQYTSELFYDNKLVASGKQPRHEVFYPLTFFTARGEDVQDQNSTAFYNNAEVYEVVERVGELQKMWPKSWGRQDETSIGIVSPYADQVMRIRSELRKRRMFGVCVERVLNVQGKQFRAIFLSTVRTRHTCNIKNNGCTEEDTDQMYGFLSNAKLLNTAITRAQSLVAVVGDPISLCSIGKCRKLWERFIEVCTEHKSLHGISYSSIRAQLDGVELKKTYVLNPLAPEFVPNRLRHGEAFLRMPSYIGPYGHTFIQQPWVSRNHYNQAAVYPNVYSYSYGWPYLYSLRPPYVGTPMMLHSPNVNNTSNLPMYWNGKTGNHANLPHTASSNRSGGRSTPVGKAKDSSVERQGSPKNDSRSPNIFKDRKTKSERTLSLRQPQDKIPPSLPWKNVRLERPLTEGQSGLPSQQALCGNSTSLPQHNSSQAIQNINESLVQTSLHGQNHSNITKSSPTFSQSSFSNNRTTPRINSSFPSNPSSRNSVGPSRTLTSHFPDPSVLNMPVSNMQRSQSPNSWPSPVSTIQRSQSPNSWSNPHNSNSFPESNILPNNLPDLQLLPRLHFSENSLQESRLISHMDRFHQEKNQQDNFQEHSDVDLRSLLRTQPQQQQPQQHQWHILRPQTLDSASHFGNPSVDSVQQSHFNLNNITHESYNAAFPELKPVTQQLFSDSPKTGFNRIPPNIQNDATFHDAKLINATPQQQSQQNHLFPRYNHFPNPSTLQHSPSLDDDKDSIVRFIEESIDRQLQESVDNDLPNMCLGLNPSPVPVRPCQPPNTPLYLRGVQENIHYQRQQQHTWLDSSPQVPHPPSSHLQQNHLSHLHQPQAQTSQPAADLEQSILHYSLMVSESMAVSSLLSDKSLNNYSDSTFSQHLNSASNNSFNWQTLYHQQPENSSVSAQIHPQSISTSQPQLAQSSTPQPLTYAGAVRASPHQRRGSPQQPSSQSQKPNSPDPLSIIKDLRGKTSASSTGLYQYFS